MANTIALDCVICLDKLEDPVVTPCGHLGCDACIRRHARGSSDPYEATCPTCRAPFPIVMPDMSIVPKKYHPFISPPLRRVFPGDDDARDSNLTVIENLKTQVTVLQARVGSLKRDKALLMDRCESAHSALTQLTADEHAARIARDQAEHDAQFAHAKLKVFRAEYSALKSRCAKGQCPSSQMQPPPQAAVKAKRTSGQAALDDSTCSLSSSPEHVNVTRPVNTPANDRLVKPIPKRIKITRAAFTEQPSPASSSGAGSSVVESSPSSSSLSAPSPACNRNVGHVTSERSLRVTRSRAARGS